MYYVCYLFSTNRENLGIVKTLLKTQADVDALDNEKRSACHTAVLAQSSECVQLMLAKGCNPNTKVRLRSK